MKSAFSLRKTATAPDQTPVPVATPEPVPDVHLPDDPELTGEPAQPAFQHWVSTLPTALGQWLRQSRVLIGLAIAFLLFWNLADWTSATGARMRPGQYAYSNEMAQLWTATYRLVFIIAVVVAIIKLTVPALIRYWRRDVEPGFDASTDFLFHLTPHQRLWFSFALLFALCYLFILLLGVRLPESPSVGL